MRPDQGRRTSWRAHHPWTQFRPHRNRLTETSTDRYVDAHIDRRTDRWFIAGTG